MRRSLAVVPCAALAAAVVITGCASSSKKAPSSAAATSAASTTTSATTSASAPATTSAATTTSAAPSSTSAAGSSSANALLTKAKAAFVAAPGVRVTGVADDAGKVTQLDLSYSHGGAEGSVSTQGITLDFIVLGHQVYFKAPNSYWKKALAGKPAALKKVEGKWVKGPDTASGFTDFGEIGDRAKYSGVIFKPTGTLTVTPAKTISGQSCVGLRDHTGTLYVAKSGSRPIETVQTSGPGRILFNYTSVPTPKAPPARQTVTIAELGG